MDSDRFSEFAMLKLLLIGIILCDVFSLYHVVGQVAPNSNPNCLSGASAWYRGTLNHTRSGIPCQRWDVNTPHVVRRVPRDGPRHNYCRNPDFDLNGLWCYTMNSSVRWEHCYLPKCPDDSLLLFASRSRFSSWISHYPADPEVGFTKPDLRATIYNNTGLSHIWTIASDKLENRVIFTDYRNNHLVVFRLGTNTTTIHMEGMVHGVEGMAYDWINKNLYLTDAQKGWVAVTDANFKYFAILYRNTSEELYAIALHVPARKLFFSTYHSRFASIKACDLDGNDVTNLITSPLVREIPSMSVDYIDRRLYWINNDSPRTYIMSANFDGTNMTTVYSRRVGRFWGISTYMDTVFLADQVGYLDRHRGRYYRLWILSKEGVPRNSYKFSSRIRALSIYSKNEEYASPDVFRNNSVCYPSNPCQQLCVESYDQKPSCLCSLGFKKIGNNKCVRNLISDNFMITSDFALRKMFQIPLDISRAAEYTMLPVDDNFDRTVQGLALDSNLKKLYWSDKNTSVIYQSLLNGSSNRPFLTGRHARDIAVDSQTGNVYFVDNDFDYIYVITHKGVFPKTLLRPRDVTTGYTRIRSIAIDHVNKHIYWSATSGIASTTSFPSNTAPLGEVRRMGLDGSDKQLVFHNLREPGALTISSERNSLFLANDGSTIYEISLDALTNPTGALPANTSSHRILGASLSNPINNIKVDGENIYITEAENNGIRRFNLSNMDDFSEFGSPDFFAPRFMTIYNATSRNNFAPRATGCDALNCQHLCLQTPNRTFTCACADSHRFARLSTSNCVHDSVDDTPPTYNACPISVDIEISSCRASIPPPPWKEPTWTDDNTSPNQLDITRPTIPGLFGTGQHRFVYSAKDRAGNIGRCSFTLTITRRTCEFSSPLNSNFKATSTKCVDGDMMYPISCKDENKVVKLDNIYKKTIWNLCLPNLEWAVPDYSLLSCVANPNSTSIAPDGYKDTGEPTKQVKKAASTGMGAGAVAGIVIAVLVILLLVGIVVIFARKNNALLVLPVTNPISMMWRKARDQDLTKSSEGADYQQFY